MKKINILILILLIFGSCNQGNDKTDIYCKCTIPESVDKQTKKGQDSSAQNWEVGANGGVEAVVKKAVDAKISISGSYSNSTSKIDEVYTEIIGSNSQITQKANLYRSVACAYYEIVCQDKSLNEKDKTAKLNEVIAGYEKNITKIFGEGKTSSNRASASNSEVAKPTLIQLAKEKEQEESPKEPIKQIRPKPTVEVNQEYEKGSWIVTLHSCKQSGTNVVCNFTVLNNGVDSKFEVYARDKSRIFSNTGSEFGLWDVKIADKSGFDGWTGKDILRGVPVKMKLSFINVFDKISSISKMEVQTRDKEDYFPLIFNNIPVN